MTDFLADGRRSARSVRGNEAQDHVAIEELSGLDLVLIAGGTDYPVCQHPNTVICETTSSGQVNCTICRAE